MEEQGNGKFVSNGDNIGSRIWGLLANLEKRANISPKTGNMFVKRLNLQYITYVKSGVVRL